MDKGECMEQANDRTTKMNENKVDSEMKGKDIVTLPASLDQLCTSTSSSCSTYSPSMLRSRTAAASIPNFVQLTPLSGFCETKELFMLVDAEILRRRRHQGMQSTPAHDNRCDSKSPKQNIYERKDKNGEGIPEARIGQEKRHHMGEHGKEYEDYDRRFNIDNAEKNSHHQQNEKFFKQSQSKERMEKLTDTTSSSSTSTESKQVPPAVSQELQTLLKLPDDHWDEMYQRLKKFLQEHGHCQVPTCDQNNCSKFYQWVRYQQRANREGKLSSAKKDLLDSIGFEWEENSIIQQGWEERFQQLQEHRKEYGHCNVLENLGKRKLGQWVRRQQQAYYLKRLSHVKVQRLQSLGSNWAALNRRKIGTWDEMYQRLKQYQQRNKHCFLSRIYADDDALGFWLRQQRDHYISNNLEIHRQHLLESIGLVWDEERAEGNKDYHYKNYSTISTETQYTSTHNETNGCNGPQSKQSGREIKKREEKTSIDATGQKEPEKNKDLGSCLGPLTGDSPSPQWNENFKRLKKFQQEHGNCLVPARDENNSTKLYQWVMYQQRMYNLGKLPPSKKYLLESIGLPLTKKSKSEQNWEDMFRRLQNFIQRYGHGNVTYGKDSSLFGWVRYQRRAHNLKTLAPSKQELLDSVGFKWNEDG